MATGMHLSALQLQKYNRPRFPATALSNPSSHLHQFHNFHRLLLAKVWVRQENQGSSILRKCKTPLPKNFSTRTPQPLCQTFLRNTLQYETLLPNHSSFIIWDQTYITFWRRRPQPPIAASSFSLSGIYLIHFLHI